jgi:hypothetical protein
MVWNGIDNGKKRKKGRNWKWVGFHAWLTNDNWDGFFLALLFLLFKLRNRHLKLAASCTECGTCHRYVAVGDMGDRLMRYAWNVAIVSRVLSEQIMPLAMKVGKRHQSWETHLKHSRRRYSGRFECSQLNVKHANDTEHSTNTRPICHPISLKRTDCPSRYGYWLGDDDWRRKEVLKIDSIREKSRSLTFLHDRRG